MSTSEPPQPDLAERRQQTVRQERTVLLAPDYPPIRRGSRVVSWGGSLDLTVEGWASGGMGLVVWGPNDARNGEWQALKVVRSDLAARPEIRAAFQREALVWNQLWHHPFVMEAVSLQGLRDTSDLLVLQMYYAQHGSLRQTLNRAHLPGRLLLLHKALAWAQQIASALESFATPDPEHDRPHALVHCDLKPENILISGADKRARVSDLGLARILAVADSPAIASGTVMTAPSHAPTPDAGEHGAITQSIRIAPDEAAAIIAHGARIAPPARQLAGVVAGTLPYMPPEQWRGLDSLTPAADIYAFGVVLFELFAGRQGFPHVPVATGDSGKDWRQAWYAAHLAGPARRLSMGDDREAALRYGPLRDYPTARRRLALPDLAPEEIEARQNAALDALDALIMPCLSVEPDARPTATQAREALSDIAINLDFKPLDMAKVALAVEHTPKKEADYWNNLATTFSFLKQRDRAVECVERCLRWAPERAVFWCNYSVHLGNVKRYDDALEALEEAQRRLAVERETGLTLPEGEDKFFIARRRGYVLRRLRRFGESVAAFEAAAAISPDVAFGWYELARSHILWSQEAHDAGDRDAELGRLRRADEAMKTAIAQQSDRVPASYHPTQELISLKIAETENGSGSYTPYVFDPIA